MKIKAFIFLLICVLLLSSCAKKDSLPEADNGSEVEIIGSTEVIKETLDEADTEAEDLEPSPELNIPAWTTDRVNFRAEPNTDADIIDTLSRKSEIVIIKELSGWDEVSYNGNVGYISSDFISTEEPKGNGIIVCIDPGHQKNGDSAKEPNGPGSSNMKARVTSGTTGRTTGVFEYQLNLEVALKLRDELEARGYTVVMTRETHDVNISNMERAKFASVAGADITVRIHANGSDNTGISGALTMAPSTSNPYVSYLAEDSYRLSKLVIDSYCKSTGLNNQGVIITDTMTGINWCTMPVTIVEMGYMTNASDDTNMQDEGFQSRMVSGIAEGIDEYFRYP